MGSSNRLAMKEQASAALVIASAARQSGICLFYVLFSRVGGDAAFLTLYGYDTLVPLL
jgi:hypothetical protein